MQIQKALIFFKKKHEGTVAGLSEIRNGTRSRPDLNLVHRGFVQSHSTSHASLATTGVFMTMVAGTTS